MKIIDSLALGAYAANCYLLWEGNHVLIVDPGSKSGRIKELIDIRGGIVDGIYLTHGHFDHIAGVDAMVKLFHCDVYINDLDVPLLSNPYLNVSSMDQPIVLKSEVTPLFPGMNTIGAFTFELIDTPGHSEGSCLMIWEGNMICGDVLFKGSVGRTDLATGSNPKMFQSLQLLRSLDPQLIVYPGHGEKTTLLDELKQNPFLV